MNEAINDMQFHLNFEHGELPRTDVLRISFPTKFKWWQLIKKYKRYKHAKFIEKARISLDGKNFINIKK